MVSYNLFGGRALRIAVEVIVLTVLIAGGWGGGGDAYCGRQQGCELYQDTGAIDNAIISSLT